MSWHFLQEREAVSSADICWDGGAFVPSNSKTILGAYCLPDSVTAYCPASPFGTTLPRSMDTHGADGSMLSAADSPVRTSAPRAGLIERDCKGKDLDCGPNSPESLARYNHHLCSWKTRQLLLSGELESFSGTWPRWGMTRDMEFFPLATLEHDTSVRDYGSLPIIGTPLKTQRSRSEEFMSQAKNPFELCPKGFLPCPKWVEKLMGWPIGWTDLDVLAMDKFRQWQHSHGGYSHD